MEEGIALLACTYRPGCLTMLECRFNKNSAPRRHLSRKGPPGWIVDGTAQHPVGAQFVIKRSPFELITKLSTEKSGSAALLESVLPWAVLVGKKGASGSRLSRSFLFNSLGTIFETSFTFGTFNLALVVRYGLKADKAL